MSAQVKKAGRIGTKIVAAFLFLFLVLFNVQVGLYDGESSERGIFGLTMSVLLKEAKASNQYCGIWNDHHLRCDYTVVVNCMCPIIIEVE